MAGKKAKFALTDFFNNLFNNFGKIVFTNLLFAVPLAVLVTAFYFLDSALKLNGYFILMLSIIPLSPFFAGVTLVTTRLARGKENVDVFKTFIEGIKNNWKSIFNSRCNYILCGYIQLFFNKAVQRINFTAECRLVFPCNALCLPDNFNYYCSCISFYFLLCTVNDSYI